MLKKIRSMLEGPSRLPVVLSIALVMMLPALAIGYVLDDLFFAAMKAAPPELPGLARGPFNLYDLTGRSAELLAARREGGDLPWYMDAGYRISFFRPLSSLSLWLDLSVSARSGLFAHLHSLAWLALLIVTLHHLYRRLASTPFVAGLGLLLFAVDEAHAVSAGWIANRNAVMSMALAVLSFLLFVRGQRDDDRRAALASPLVLGAALLSGEMAVTIAAYFFAYMALLDDRPWSRRIAALAPAAVVIVAWRVAYNMLGHGVHGTGYYIDPVASPGRFLLAAARYVPVLLQSQFTPVQAELTLFTPPAFKAPFYTLAAFSTFLLVLVVLPWARGHRVARFACVATLLACVPLASSEPSNRLMLPLGPAGCLLTAELLAGIWAARKDPQKPLLSRLPYRIVGGLAVITHLVIAPLTLPLWAFFPSLFDVHSRHASRSLDRVGEFAGKTLVIVHTPDFFFSNWIPIFRLAEGRSLPGAVRVLGESTDPITVTRPSDRTLTIANPRGFVRGVMADIVRDPEVPLTVGSSQRTSDLTIEVTAVDATRKPTEIVCRFAAPLDDPSRAFVRWTALGYAPFPLPAVGETVTLEGVDPKSVFAYRYNEASK